MELADILLLVNCAVAVMGAIALMATALVRTQGPLSIRSVGESATLSLLALVVLSRGAPHNNPLLFAIYDRHGALGMLALAGAMAIIAVACAVVSRPTKLQLPPLTLTQIVAGLTLLAVLAAAEPVIRYWNVPEWGDSILYDRNAVSIARGVAPAGHSYYMPVFQYGPALFYWAFGHFFFVQQVINVFWAAVTVPLLALAAWNFFRSSAAVFLVSLLAATIDTLRHSPFLLQVENWYVPIFCFSIFASSCYLRHATLRSAILLGCAVGLIFEIRTQAGFYVGFLCLAPMWLRHTPAMVKVKHFITIVSVVIVFAVPWTLRNLAVDHRFSPIGSQAGDRISSTNSFGGDFFGIRRDLITAGVVPPVPNRPSAAFGRILNMISNPALTIQAGWWRGLAFYGILPPGIWEKAGPRATTLSELPGYLLRTGPTFALLIASALGLLLRPGRMTIFLLGGLAANIVIVFFAGFSEPRLSYPIAALHILLATAAIFPPRSEFFAPTSDVNGLHVTIPRAVPTAAIAIVVLLLIAHGFVGRRLLYPPQTGSSLLHIGAVTIDQTVPNLNSLNKTDLFNVPPGTHARFTGVITNGMEPVKWYSHPIAGYPSYTTDPKGESYFRSYLLDDLDDSQWGGSRPFGLTLAGAAIDRPLYEDDAIEVEGQLLDIIKPGIFWFKAEKIRHLDVVPASCKKPLECDRPIRHRSQH